MTITHQIEVYKHHETDAAILVGENYMRDHHGHAWLPKSQIDWTPSRLDHGTPMVIVTAPEWLLVDKGLEHLV
jgi:hypothetical protein